MRLTGVAFHQVLLGALASLAVLGVSTSRTAAQGYPSRPIKLIVPLATGGPADTAARVFAVELGNSIGHNVIVENRAGASGVVGTEAVIKSTADGYSLLFGSSSVFAVNPAVMPNLRFDVRRDLKLIGLVAQTEHLLAVRPEIGAKTLAELVTIAKAQPGRLSYASTGAGGIAHLASELFTFETGTKMLHIPFRGGGPAVVGVLSADAHLLINDISTTLTHIKSGKLIALALASPKRSPQLPDVATFIELGYPGIESRSWYGLAAPAGTPADAVTRLEKATAAIAAAPDFQAGLAEAGLQPLVMTPAETVAFIEHDLDKWSRVAKSANIQLDN